MSAILGLNAYHGDSAACLVRDGQLVAAAEEERFRRIKHWAGLPTEAIKYCLQEGGLRFGDLDHIAINRQPGVNNWRRLFFVLRHRPDFGLIKNRLRNIRHAASVEDSLRAAFPGETTRASIHHVEHHLAHLASAFLVSPFEEAVCLSVDGFGDFASAAWGLGRGGEIPIDGRVYFPHSLGIFYSAITQWLGFPHFGDEYKVMGLAPCGEPKYLALMREIVRVQRDGTYELNLRFFRHHTENVSYSWKDCAPEVGTLYTPALDDLLGPTRQPDQPLEQKHRDMARSAQAMYEEAFFALLKTLHAKYQCPNLALSGGCAMNSVANGKVYLESPFKKLYLPAAAGDAGGAIGAAFAVARERTPHSSGPRPSSPFPSAVQSSKFEVQGSRFDAPSHLPSAICHLPSAASQPVPHFVMSHAYTGPQFDDPTIEKVLQSRGLPVQSSRFDVQSSRFPVPTPSSSPVAPSPVQGSKFDVQGSMFPAPTPSSSPAVLSPVQGSKFDVQGSKFTPRPSPLAAPPSSLVTRHSSPSPELAVTHFTDPGELCRRTAKAISDGGVIGWFQGRMEWGPRALGNRSILCDPRCADMKEILNAKIKRRESFRPFAPSILREHVAEWFEQEDDVPFMMEVFKFRAEKRALVPAVCHVDGSGRLQTVHRNTNPLYHQLISEFCALTSVPIVLNTSFNENEPVVCRPEEALDCFLRTKMDVLVLGNFFIERTP